MMEGFGSIDGATYNYGSVEDGYIQNPTLEQRLKKKYWKTKQTVITKLKREEDEHVVAGDADIDIKLEKARHLQTSCQKLLQALAKCSYHTQNLSSHEVSLSEFLLRSGEHDFTHAGEVMKQVGQAHDRNAKMRMRTVEPIFRLQQEFVTFSNSAIGDLSESIKHLEKARVDYRAALLWMKDVSQRLHDPDARGQLAKFRETQATVKESKVYFEKMKFNLMEKINMVAASRCNLLSHTLPHYQKEMLAYLDYSANELHKVLVSLKSQTQHQYKLNFLLDEEGEFDIPQQEGEEEQGGDKATQSSSDGSLFGLLQQELGGRGGGGNKATPPTFQSEEGLPSPFVSDLLFSTEEEDEEGDGVKREVREGGEEEKSQQPQRDLLTEEWDEFSALDSKSLIDTPGDNALPTGANNDNSSSNSGNSILMSGDDWTDDLVEAEQPPSRELMDEINELMAFDEQKKDPTSVSLPNTTTTTVTGTTNPDKVVFDPLLEEKSSSVRPPLSSELQNLSLDNPLMPSKLLPLAPPPFSFSNVSVPPVFPSPNKTMPTYSLSSSMGRGSTGYKPMVGAAKDPEDSPAQRWAKLFSHLDPIANEKA